MRNSRMSGNESNLSCIPSSSISPLNLKRNSSDTNKLRSRFSQDAVFYLQQASGTFQFSFFLRRCSTCFKSNVIFTICFILDQSPCLEQHGCVIEVKKTYFHESRVCLATCPSTLTFIPQFKSWSVGPTFSQTFQPWSSVTPQHWKEGCKGFKVRNSKMPIC